MDTINELFKRLNLVIDLAELGIWDFDPRLTPYYWNARAKTHFGFSLDAAVTKQDLLEAIHPHDRQFVAESLERALRPDEGSYAFEFRTVSQDGNSEEKFIEAKGLVQFASGVAVRVIGITRDVSAQHRYECELMSALQEATLNQSKQDFVQQPSPEMSTAQLAH